MHVDRVTTEHSKPAATFMSGTNSGSVWDCTRSWDHWASLRRPSPLRGAMTLNRLIHPAAEYAMPDWIRSTALADILKADFSTLTYDPLYRNLDRLYPHRAKIESALAEREGRLFILANTRSGSTT